VDTGIDKKQIEALKRFGRRLTTEPARLRLAVCVLFAGVGIFAIDRPLGARLARARADNKEAHETARMAEEAVFFTKQRGEYDSRVQIESDITNWQNYVLEKLRCTTATLISIEPRKPITKGPFTVLEMEVVVKGRSYQEFADFVDRIERGERIVRVDKLRMERQQSSIYLTCIIKGLVKAAAAPKDGDAKAAGKGKTAGKKDAPRDEAILWVGPTLADDALPFVGPLQDAAATPEPAPEVVAATDVPTATDTSDADATNAIADATDAIADATDETNATASDDAQAGETVAAETEAFVGPVWEPAGAIAPVGWAALGRDGGAEGGPR